MCNVEYLSCFIQRARRQNTQRSGFDKRRTSASIMPISVLKVERKNVGKKPQSYFVILETMYEWSDMDKM